MAESHWGIDGGCTTIQNRPLASCAKRPDPTPPLNEFCLLYHSQIPNGNSAQVLQNISSVMKTELLDAI